MAFPGIHSVRPQCDHLFCLLLSPNLQDGKETAIIVTMDSHVAPWLSSKEGLFPRFETSLALRLGVPLSDIIHPGFAFFIEAATLFLT